MILSNCRDIAPKKLHISTRNASPTRFENISTSLLQIENSAASTVHDELDRTRALLAADNVDAVGQRHALPVDHFRKH